MSRSFRNTFTIFGLIFFSVQPQDITIQTIRRGYFFNKYKVKILSNKAV